jgi:hypothetical protein
MLTLIRTQQDDPRSLPPLLGEHRTLELNAWVRAILGAIVGTSSLRREIDCVLDSVAGCCLLLFHAADH